MTQTDLFPPPVRVFRSTSPGDSNGDIVCQVDGVRRCRVRWGETDSDMRQRIREHNASCRHWRGHTVISNELIDAFVAAAIRDGIVEAIPF